MYNAFCPFLVTMHLWCERYKTIKTRPDWRKLTKNNVQSAESVESRNSTLHIFLV